MMRISGPGAQAQVEALSTLLDTAPALKPQVAEAEWVGNRRWNITFKTGQALALPQGAERSSGALMEFARLDGTNRLLGGKAVAFDMRNAPRVYILCPLCREEERAQLSAAEGT
jgi:cell division protein FtsQ